MEMSSVTNILAETYASGGGGAEGRRGCAVRPMYWAALACLLHAVAMGFCVGYSAPATYSMRRSPQLRPSEEHISWIGSVLPLGAMCGGLVGGPLSDAVGRRSALLLNVLVLTLGWFTIVEAAAVEAVVLGRFLCGLGCGVVSVAAPAYCVEVATPEARGLLGALCQAFAAAGALLAALLGAALDWRALALTAAAAGGAATLLVAACPESPKWLLAQGDRGRARQALRRLHGAECELPEAQPQPRGCAWLHPAVWKPALIVLALMLLQQCSGANAILFFATHIFEANQAFLPPASANIVLCLAQLAATLASSLLVERAGRRPLLLLSATVAAISELLLAIFYFECGRRPGLAAAYPWVPLLCVAVFVVAFSLGLGPLPWLLAAELVPLRARSRVGALATFANGLFTFLVTKTFGSLVGVASDFGAFTAYGLVSSLSCVFVVAFVPETKGKDARDISAFFCKDAEPLQEVHTITSFPPIQQQSQRPLTDRTVPNLAFEQLHVDASGSKG